MRQLDADIGDTLELFGYTPAAPPGEVTGVVVRGMEARDNEAGEGCMEACTT
jgi:hypothetical protein